MWRKRSTWYRPWEWISKEIEFVLDMTCQCRKERHYIDCGRKERTKIVSLSTTVCIWYDVDRNRKRKRKSTTCIVEWCEPNKEQHASILSCYIIYVRIYRTKRRKEKEIDEYEHIYTYVRHQKHGRMCCYIWNKLVVHESDITIFVQIPLTHQWSSFSRMILWWSDCSASASVFVQLTSNVVK